MNESEVAETPVPLRWWPSAGVVAIIRWPILPESSETLPPPRRAQRVLLRDRKRARPSPSKDFSKDSAKPKRVVEDYKTCKATPVAPPGDDANIARRCSARPLGPTRLHNTLPPPPTYLVIGFTHDESPTPDLITSRTSSTAAAPSAACLETGNRRDRGEFS